MLKKGVHKGIKWLIGIILIIVFFRVIIFIVNSQKNISDIGTNSYTKTSDTEETDKSTYMDNLKEMDNEQSDVVFEEGFQFEDDERVYIGDYVSFIVPSGFEKERSEGDVYLYGKKENGDIIYYLYCYTEDQYQQDPDEILSKHENEYKIQYGEGNESSVSIGDKEWKKIEYDNGSFMKGYSFSMYECMIDQQYVSIGFATINECEYNLEQYADEILETVKTDFE